MVRVIHSEGSEEELSERSRSRTRSPPRRRRPQRREAARVRTAREQALELGLNFEQAAAIRAILTAPVPGPAVPAALAPPAALAAQGAPAAPAPYQGPQPVEHVYPLVPAQHMAQRGGGHGGLVGGNRGGNRGGQRGGRGAARGGRGGAGPWVTWGMRLPSHGPYTPFCRRHGTPYCINCMYYNPNEEF